MQSTAMGKILRATSLLLRSNAPKHTTLNFATWIGFTATRGAAFVNVRGGHPRSAEEARYGDSYAAASQKMGHAHFFEGPRILAICRLGPGAAAFFQSAVHQSHKQ